MKSRAIALGASVIALTLAGGGQAAASGLGSLNQDLGAKTQTSASGPAGSIKVDGNVKIPVEVPSRGSIEKRIDKAARGVDPSKSHASTTVEAKRKSGDDRSDVVLDVNSHTGVSAYVDQRRKGEFELEAEGQGGPRHADTTVTGFARHAGKAHSHGGAYAPKVKHGSIRELRKLNRRAVQKSAGGDVLRSTGGHKKPLARLRAIGREVGNPIQLSLGGWLIAMAMAGGLGVARLVRRLQHLS